MNQTPPPPPPSQLIKDPEALVGVLRRLHSNNDGVVFYNQQGTLKLMLRNDPVDSETICAELMLVFDEDDDAMIRVVDLDNGFPTEPGGYVLDSWTFQDAEMDAGAVGEMMAFLNQAFLYTLCPCGNYLVKDEASICSFCQLTRSKEDKTPHFCAICFEEGLQMHMKHLGCCTQYLHTACLTTWRSKSGDDRCPLCRQM